MDLALRFCVLGHKSMDVPKKYSVRAIRVVQRELADEGLIFAGILSCYILLFVATGYGIDASFGCQRYFCFF